MRVLQMHGNNTRDLDCKVDVSIVSTEFPVTTFVSHSRMWSSIVEQDHFSTGISRSFIFYSCS